MFICLTRNLLLNDNFIWVFHHIFTCILSQNCSWVLQDFSILFLSWDLIYFIPRGNSENLDLKRFGFFETSGIKIKVFPQPAPHLSVQAAGSSPGHFPLQPTWKEGKVPGWETEEEGRYYTKNSENLFQNKRKQTSFQNLQPHHRENPVPFWVIY